MRWMKLEPITQSEASQKEKRQYNILTHIYGIYKDGNDNPQGRPRHPTPVLLPGKSHGQRRLVGCSPWGREESDSTERLHCHFSLSCTGEGNGNPLQCSCLENPRDGGAWWAAVYGVARSRTRLTRLSSNDNPVCKTVKETQMYWTVFWTLWERARWDDMGEWHWNM